MASLQRQKTALISSVQSQSYSQKRQLSNPKTSTTRRQEIATTKTEAIGNFITCLEELKKNTS